MKRTLQIIAITIIAVITALQFPRATSANTRTMEIRFALSSDIRSEFSKRFPVLSSGRISVEASWEAIGSSDGSVPLSLILVRPDGTEAVRRNGLSILRLEHQAGQQYAEGDSMSERFTWTVKLLNDNESDRKEVTGRLRITVPVTNRSLIDMPFTLLDSGNALEIPFAVPAFGRIVVEASWELADQRASKLPITVSLIHPGQSLTYARRQGSSPLRIEHQITEQDMDRGKRWIVRLQNNSQSDKRFATTEAVAKVQGRLVVSYTPGF